MDEPVEKSCWGVTLWAIAIVLSAVVIGSFMMGQTTVSNANAPTVSTS